MASAEVEVVNTGANTRIGAGDGGASNAKLDPKDANRVDLIKATMTTSELSSISTCMELEALKAYVVGGGWEFLFGDSLGLPEGKATEDWPKGTPHRYRESHPKLRTPRTCTLDSWNIRVGKAWTMMRRLKVEPWVGPKELATEEPNCRTPPYYHLMPLSKQKKMKQREATKKEN
ncbi:hypothetical protein COCNU_05G005920 [Cocos nucifera]|uniref:Uncharacterized protein n=1 Tax=Cocos nucifera TaxID=13894 RepID=A0A8K0I8N1_COCNU|nr:hypothetical protein COCNU_05G005920 [Cocos nucifera]